jgi:bacterial leucyl aminopeptidase
MVGFVLALGLFGLAGNPLPGDLVVFDRDIRTLETEPWMSAVTIVYREADYFIGVVPGSSATGGIHRSVLAEGPLTLDEFRIGLIPVDGVLPADIPGDVIFTRGSIVIVRLGEPTEDPVSVRGMGILGRLHPYLPGPVSHALPPTGGTDGYVDEMVSAVNEDSILAVIQHFEDYGTRYMFSPQYDACADWVDTWMSNHWIPCELQAFEYSGDSMSNVVAEIPGVEEPEVIFVICGHLDSYCEVNPDVFAPGADDDGSGCAGVLEAARAMSQYSFRHTIRFVCFAAEEAWMVGSYYYVSQASAAGDDIQGTVNLDMILYAPDAMDTLYMAFDGQSSALAQFAAVTMSSYVPQLPTFVDYNPGDAGDHNSFWQFGYPAIVGAEASADEVWGGYNPWYHQPGDILANYMPSFPYGTDAIRGAVAIVASLAEPVGPSSAGGAEGSSACLSIAPNPSPGQFTALLDGVSASAGYRVYDLSGRMVSEGELSPSSPSCLDLQFLPAGVYTLACTSPGIGPQRLVIVR